MTVRRKAVKEIGGGSNYRAWKEWDIGDMIEGELLAVSQDKFKKPNYKLKVTECSFDKSLIGKNFTLNSNGALDHKMAEINVGQVVYVEYEGTTVLAKGPYKGKECHSIFCGVVQDDGSVHPDEDEDL